MINYVRKTIQGIDTNIPTRFDNSFIINDKDFEYLINLYRFIPNREGKCWIDKKHNKTVAFLDKNLFSNEYEIHFNKSWLAHECIITKASKLLEILQNYPENKAAIRQTLEILHKIAEKDAKYLAKGDYVKKPFEYFDDNEENTEINQYIDEF